MASHYLARIIPASVNARKRSILLLKPRLVLAIDSLGLQVYGVGEWKVKKHGIDGKRRVWRKLHIAAELSLSGVTDAEVMPNLLKQNHRKIRNILGDCA